MTIPMTPLEAFTRLPWTWLGPTEVREDDGIHYEMRVAELPNFFVAGESQEEVQSEREDALHAFLASYVERDETPPYRPTWVVVPHSTEWAVPFQDAPTTQRLRFRRVLG